MQQTSRLNKQASFCSGFQIQVAGIQWLLYDTDAHVIYIRCQQQAVE